MRTFGVKGRCITCMKTLSWTYLSHSTGCLSAGPGRIKGTIQNALPFRNTSIFFKRRQQDFGGTLCKENKRPERCPPNKEKEKEITSIGKGGDYVDRKRSLCVIGAVKTRVNSFYAIKTYSNLLLAFEKFVFPLLPFFFIFVP